MRVLVIMFIFSVAPSYTQTDLPGPVRALSNFVTPQPIASWNVAQTFYSGFVDAGSTGHNNVWKLPTASVSGCLQDNGSYTLNITACPPGSPSGADKDVQINSGGFFYADANFQYNHVSPQVVTVTGVSGNPSIVAVTSFIQSDQGFLSKANNWQAFNTLTDGSLLRAYHLDHPDASTGAPQYTGGYIDIAMITYIPTGGAAYPPHDPRNCYDQFANLASNPIPLNGLSSFGAGDILIWNSPSPLQGYLGGSPYHINGTPCGAPIPLPVYDGISNNTGLNTNAYILAMGGFATPVNSAQAVQIWSGGVTALEYFAAGFYPAGTVTTTGTLTSAAYLGGFMYMGHSTTAPGNGVGCTSIASCDNPLIPGLGLLQGQFYWNDSVHNPQVFDGTNWDNYALQATTVTFTGIIDTGTSSNSLQVPSGGLLTGLGLTVGQAFYPHGFSTCPTLNNPATSYGGIGYNTGSVYCYWNGTSWNPFDFSAGTTNYWTLVGADLHNNAGTHVIAGTTADDGSGYSLQSHSGLSVTGNIHATGSGGLSYVTGQDFVVGNTAVLDYTGSATRTLQVVTPGTSWVAFRMTDNATSASNVGAYLEFATTDTAITAGDHRFGEDQWYRVADITGGQVTASYSKFLTNNGTIYQRESISGNTHNVLGPGNVANEVFSVLDNSGSGNGYIQLGRNGTTLSQLVGIAGGDFAIDAVGVANNVFYLYNAGAQTGTLGIYQGNVGVKTLVPNWPLDVHGGNSNQIHVNGNNSGAGGFIYASNGDNNINVSGGHYFNGTNWIAAAGSSGMMSATGGGVFLYHNTANGIGGVVPLNEVAGFTNTNASIFSKTTIGTAGSIASQINFNSAGPATDNGGYLTSNQDNTAFLSGGMEFSSSSSWVARSSGGASALTVVGGSGISVLINNTTTSGFAFTPVLTASFRATSFNFTGNLNNSLGIVSPFISSGTCSLTTGATNTRGFLNPGTVPTTCIMTFAGGGYSSAPYCLISPTPSFVPTTTTTTMSVFTNSTAQMAYFCIQ